MQPAAALPQQLGSIGPYLLLEQLGAGGMGVVYRARHSGTGQLVALKTVRLPDAALMRGLRRELHALGRLRHPGIVQVLAEGVDDGLPWYAMEFLEGSTLRELLAAWWREAPDSSAPAAGRLTEALGLVRRICAALGFLHGEGIVHRDLKPDNIVVRPDGQPVLMDFGLVSAFGGARSRESLDVGGAMEGSSGYMAPEQISGELVDARADLYALGCILYEMVTGRPVFSGEGWDVLRQHLSEPPPPPSRWVRGVPPALEELLMRLLAKQSRERIGYASDVSSGLASLGARVEDGTYPPQRAYLYRPEFVGRRALLEEAERALDDARWGRGRCVLLGAESGAGKTRLAMELATAANRRDFRVITGECLPLEVAAPLQPFRPLLQAVADHCRAGGAQVTGSLLGEHGPLLALYEPSLASLSPPGTLAEPAALPAQEARQRLLGALTQVLSAFVAEQPMLLVLDDLHWADELSLSVLEHLQRGELERLPMLVLGTWRTEEENEGLRRLLLAPGLTSTRLERLDAEAVATMVCGMLALRTPPRAFVEYLARQSEGNPFFVAEYLRTAVDEGLLGRDAAGVWQVAERGVALDRLEQALPLPGSLRELLGRWLSGLRPDARELLERAAVLGREFDGVLLLPERTMDDAGQLEALEALRVRNVLEEAGEGRLRFAHDKLREMAYESTPPESRRRLHEEAARAIESRYSGTGLFPRHYGALAHHWATAQAEEKALHYLEEAARQALRIGANTEAAGYLEKALAMEARHAEAPARGHRRASWEYLLGEAFFGLGDLARAREHLHRALEVLGQPLPRMKPAWGGLLLGQMTRQLAHMLLPEPAVQAEELEQEPLRTAALATSRLCECYYFTQDMLAMSASAIRAVNLAERAGRRGEVRRQYAQLGYMAGLARMHPLARRYFRLAREGGSSAGELAGIATALWYEASYELTFARWSHAAQRADEAIQLLARLGSQGDLQIARTLRAHTDYYTGHFEASLPRFEEIRDSGRKWSNMQYEAWGEYSLARSLIPLGRLEEAVTRLQEARTLLARQADRASDIICHGLLATAHLYRGELEPARRMAEEVMRLTQGAQPTAFTEGKGYEGAALVLLAAWEDSQRGTSGVEATLAQQARESVARLEQCARMFPFVRPAALRCSGLMHWLSGRAERARSSWRESIASAHELGMPYDEALARIELARAGEPGTPEREAHLLRASELFSLMGCTWHLQEVEGLGLGVRSRP
ncbi:AAA family ATPase [Archangium violaceum]|uniref:serine/threonine-protein kinase n=1 Tax=Archangium violaceum TaxID=83451 RepID=UPI0019504CA1|nr:serine/threonine-protein kinase [Archangium violaceum]QRN97848.1 AAA family ATPase [Archangium violaceum]